MQEDPDKAGDAARIPPSISPSSQPDVSSQASYSNPSTITSGILQNLKGLRSELGRPSITNKDLQQFEEQVYLYSLKADEDDLFLSILNNLTADIRKRWFPATETIAAGKRRVSIDRVFSSMKDCLTAGEDDIDWFKELNKRSRRHNAAFEKAIDVTHCFLRSGWIKDGEDNREALLRRKCRALGLLCQYGLEFELKFQGHRGNQQAMESIFRALTSGVSSNRVVRNFKFAFETIYLSISPQWMYGRSIVWCNSSGSGKSFVARTLCQEIPSFIITLGPPLNETSNSKIQIESTSLPAPDNQIVLWLRKMKNHGIGGAKKILAALMGTLYKQLFCLCVDELSHGEIRVDIPSPYDVEKAVENVLSAKGLLSTFATNLCVSQVVAVTNSLNVVDVKGTQNEKRNKFISAVLDEAGELLSIQGKKITACDTSKGLHYLHHLNVYTSIEAFFALIDSTKDGKEVRLSDPDDWKKAFGDQPHEARPMQSFIVWDECHHLNAILHRDSQTNRGIHELKQLYADLLDLTQLDPEILSPKDKVPARIKSSKKSASTPKPGVPMYSGTDDYVRQRSIDRVWCILLDTTSETDKLVLMGATERIAQSERLGEKYNYPIFYRFGRDHNLPEDSTLVSLTVKEMHSIVDHLKYYGRGLWSPFMSMSVLSFAATKLLGGAGRVFDKTITPETMKANSLFSESVLTSKAVEDVDPIVFAVSSYIIGMECGIVTAATGPLEVTGRRSSDWSKFYLTQVARHMRTIWSIEEDGTMKTLAMPEPMLSMSAMALVAYGRGVLGEIGMEHKKSNDRRARLLESIATLTLDSYNRTNTGEVGEMFGRLILTFAMLDCFPDVWCPAKNTSAMYATIRIFLGKLYGCDRANQMLEIINKQARRRGDNRDIGNAIINFHQWTQVYDDDDTRKNDYSINCNLLEAMFRRLCAIICKKDAAGIDLIIPVILPPKGADPHSSLEDLPYFSTEMGYIAIQIKLKRSAHGITEYIHSPSVEGTDAKGSLFNLVMDLGTLTSFSESRTRGGSPTKSINLTSAPKTPSEIKKQSSSKQRNSLRSKQRKSNALPIESADINCKSLSKPQPAGSDQLLISSSERDLPFSKLEDFSYPQTSSSVERSCSPSPTVCRSALKRTASALSFESPQLPIVSSSIKNDKSSEKRSKYHFDMMEQDDKEPRFLIQSEVESLDEGVFGDIELSSAEISEGFEELGYAQGVNGKMARSDSLHPDGQGNLAAEIAKSSTVKKQTGFYTVVMKHNIGDKISITEDKLTTSEYQTYNTTIRVRDASLDEYPCLDLKVPGYDYEQALDRIKRAMHNTREREKATFNPCEETSLVDEIEAHAKQLRNLYLSNRAEDGA